MPHGEDLLDETLEPRAFGAERGHHVVAARVVAAVGVDVAPPVARAAPVGAGHLTGVVEEVSLGDSDVCPACSTALHPADEECPECGLCVGIAEN